MADQLHVDPATVKIRRPFQVSWPISSLTATARVWTFTAPSKMLASAKPYDAYVSPALLAPALQLGSPVTVSKAVKGLEQRNLVKRHPGRRPIRQTVARGRLPPWVALKCTLIT
jgi:hypothetical protein